MQLLKVKPQMVHLHKRASDKREKKSHLNQCYASYDFIAWIYSWLEEGSLKSSSVLKKKCIVQCILLKVWSSNTRKLNEYWKNTIININSPRAHSDVAFWWLRAKIGVRFTLKGKHTDKRCWFKPPFASIIRKPLVSDNSENH